VSDRVLTYPFAYQEALEPPEELPELRAKCPMADVRLPDGKEAKLLTRYHDVKSLLSDPRFARVPGANGLEADDDDADGVPNRGERHQQWRRLVSKWFTAKRMASLRPGIREIAEQLIDDMMAKGAPADLKASFGFPLPVYVICDMLGVPAEDRDRFSHWSDAMISLTRFSGEEVARSRAEFTEYMAALIAAKRADPSDDLLSELIKAGENGPALSDKQLVGTGIGLLIAGHETTANMIGKMVAMLLADRTRWQRLLGDRKLVRTAVEEVLRFDANLGMALSRLITEDIEVAGEQVSRGTTVLCDLAAANRDESAYEGAGEMDLDRMPNPHLAFGAGPHSCLGQALARTELQVVLETLLDRLPSLDLAVSTGELRRVDGLLPGGLEELPVRW
jgi:cytochrome P450